MNLLVIRFSALGDVAMTVPVIKSFANQHPDINITVLTRNRFTPLFSWMPENVKTIGVNLTQYKGVLGLYKLYKELKKEQFDCVADLHNVLRTKIIRRFFRLNGCSVSVINKGRKEKKALIGKGTEAEPLKPMKERYWETLVKSVGSKKAYIKPTTKRNVECQGAKEIGIAPFAAYETKMYPLDKMKTVVSMLAEKGVKVFLFGGGSQEQDILKQWEGKGVVSMCGRSKGLKEELEIISNLNLMVCMDSGNLHLASLVGTPTISIWGATHPKAGFAPDDTVVIQKTMSCRPCSIYGNKECKYGDMRCLSSIEPEEIVGKIMELI